MPILTCIHFTFNWLTLTSEMHFVKFHPEVASCLLSRGKRKYAPLGMMLLWKYINYFLVYHLISHFLLSPNYKEFEDEILDLQSEKYGLSFDIKKYTTSGWALGDENVIGIRAFNISILKNCLQTKKTITLQDVIYFDCLQNVGFWFLTCYDIFLMPEYQKQLDTKMLLDPLLLLQFIFISLCFVKGWQLHAFSP